MDSRKPIDGTGSALMLLLCLTWSGQQLVLKWTAADMAPVLQIALRCAGAALLVLALMQWRSERIDFAAGPWRPGLLCGLLFAFEFLLAGIALQYTLASHVIVFVYTAPIFAALGLHAMRIERLVPLQWLGIAISFAGIAIAFIGHGETALPDGVSLAGDAMALGAGAGWGATTVVVRSTRLGRAPATEALLYQLVVAFVLLMIAAIVLGQTAYTTTPRLIGGLAFQTVIVTFASFLTWFWLLQRYLAWQLGVFSFITPLFGVLLGAWLLDEALEAGFLVGAALVVLGILLVSGHAWLKRITGSN